MHEKDGWPKEFLAIHPLRRVGRAILELCSMHQLSPVSEHFQHPLDAPLEPVTDWPPESDGIQGSLFGGMQPDSALHIPPRNPFS